MKRIKLERCKFRSVFNPIKLRVEIFGHRIHHFYIGISMLLLTQFIGHLNFVDSFGQMGTLVVPTLSAGEILFTLDDAFAHLRNWIRGVKD